MVHAPGYSGAVTEYIVTGLFGTRAVLEHHLTECGDRYKAAAESLRRLEDKIDETRRSNDEGRRRLYGLLWTVAGATIMGLLTAVATLVLKLIHP
jgi:hypothetical protein